ncbi:putative integral membrane protein [Cellulomonas flavigena DSM 20109]|uniref:Putative integral membrane protein n=1 Tax=Cellulomonas flavigena (strain ATCC 482 / DSM 20109 / BCRC 11376 / JCM 18109 / NBRC 3775 / NCIMB 8073 / NRS 134) TaxID=446466 RepID=D5UBY5_CELFN|nr:putative integral membrane protein [Cellulomonas flavigena DSM 20109]
MRFREVRYATAGVGAVAVTIGVAVAVNLLLSAWPSATSDVERALFALLAVAVVALCVLVARMSSVTEVSADGVSLAFRLGVTVWRRRIARDDLAVDGVEQVGVVRAGGLGLRFLGAGRVALMVRSGPGVVLRTLDGRRTYVVGSDRIDELLGVLVAHR